MKHSLIIISLLFLSLSASAQKVTIHAVNQPAASVFRNIVEQTGKNFVYSSELLKDITVSVDARNKPLKKVLDEMFKDKGIEYSIKGKNVILKAKPVNRKVTKPTAPRPRLNTSVQIPDSGMSTLLEDLIVVSRLERPVVETSEIGARKITTEEVKQVPALFGESDVIKAVQSQPGVVEGIEGLAGMYVHGGNSDENLYMLDNIPMYHVNHFAGLFSAFNPDILRYIDFYKASFPAKYDGRLSSFMDARTLNGSREGHHGSARLGLTSGAFNISGPIGEKTNYLVGLRRSWFDVLTVPIFAIVNHKSDWEKIKFQYYFMDLNAKVSHRFSSRANGFVSVYFGDDLLRSGTEDKDSDYYGWYENDQYSLHWGNLLVQTGLNYRLNQNLTAEFTAAYTRFFSNMKHDDEIREKDVNEVTTSRLIMKTENNINDWILRGDFDWYPQENSHVRFGGGYTLHSFLPARTSREFTINDDKSVARDSTWVYRASEFNAYIEDDWSITPVLRANIGLHASLFYIDRKLHHGLSPRVSIAWNPDNNWAFKAAYSRTTQYVHQLSQSYLSLPTDQWIPIMGKFKPQTADKISVGAYWQTDDRKFTVSIEGYYKRMHNLIEYRDEYYLLPPMEMWNARLTSGRGTAKGIDFSLEKNIGKFTGRIGYSLAWADRTFQGKNGGKTYPAKFDNRHTINILLNWKCSDKVTLSANWTGHSGNRFTFMPQVWDNPDLIGEYYYSSGPLLRTDINNYQLPFYHRLDLACNVKNKRGYWTFSLYNAYCHLNTIALIHRYVDYVESTPESFWIHTKPKFQKVKFLPILPSISYTWQF